MFNSGAIIVIGMLVLIIIIGLFDNTKEGYYIYSLFGSTKKELTRYSIVMIAFWCLGLIIKDSYDIGFYRDAYERRVSHGKEPLFDIVQFFFHDIGISFDVFKAIWVSIIAILLYKGIKKYALKPHQASAIAFISIFLSFITQMRSAMAFSIILNVIPLLFSGKKRDRLLYGIIVILCGQIHIVSYIYLILLFVGLKKERKFGIRYYIVIVILSVFSLGFNLYFVDIISLIVKIFPAFQSFSERIISSVDGIGTPIKAAIFLIIKQTILFILTEISCKYQEEFSFGKLKIQKYISEINHLSLVFLVICIVNESFTRLFTIIALLQFSSIMNTGEYFIEMSVGVDLKIRMKTFLIGFVLLVFAIEFHSNPDDFVRIMNSIVNN